MRLMIFSLLTALLAGCVSYAESYVETHPNLSPEVREAILAGKVIKGMTPNEVIAAWGSPDRTVSEVAEDSSKRILKKFIYAYRGPVMSIGVGFGHVHGPFHYGVGATRSYYSGSSAEIYFEGNKVDKIQFIEH